MQDKYTCFIRFLFNFIPSSTISWNLFISFLPSPPFLSISDALPSSPGPTTPVAGMLDPGDWIWPFLPNLDFEHSLDQDSSLDPDPAFLLLGRNLRMQICSGEDTLLYGPDPDPGLRKNRLRIRPFLEFNLREIAKFWGIFFVVLRIYLI